MEVVIHESRLQGVGLPPGEIGPPVHGAPSTPARLRVLSFGPEGCEQIETDQIDQALARLGQKSVTWVQVMGISQVSLIREIGQRLNIHPLALEDVATTWGRAKLQDYGNQLFVVGKAAVLNRSDDQVVIEQVSMVMGVNYLITFQETPSALFEPIERRLLDPQRAIRKQPAGYLLYALLDTLVDHLLQSMDAIDEEVIAMEDGVLNHKNLLNLDDIYRHKRSVVLLSRMASPMREVAKGLEMIDNALIPDALDYYFSDLNDHSTRAAERINHARAVLQSLQEYYHIRGDHLNNYVMRVLTVVATIFIPMTFVTGIYGMNFHNANSVWSMPELNTAFGYPVIMGCFLLYALVAFSYFRRKGWFKQ